MFEYVERGSLLGPNPPKSFARAWRAAQAATFDSATVDAPPAHPLLSRAPSTAEA
jgi:hypothetical protein